MWSKDFLVGTTSDFVSSLDPVLTSSAISHAPIFPAMQGSMSFLSSCIMPILLSCLIQTLSIASLSRLPTMYSSNTGFLARTSSWSPASWGRNVGFPQQGGNRSPGYLSSALKSVTRRSQRLNRSQTGFEDAFESKNRKHPSDIGPVAASTSGSRPFFNPHFIFFAIWGFV